MPCPELTAQLAGWLNSDATPFEFRADGGEVCLRHLAQGVLVGARLSLNTLNEPLLQDALRLGQPSLARFPGALARSPSDGQLWLLQRLEHGCACDELIASLETLLNQRDTWQAMLAGSALRVRSLPPSPQLLEEGPRYA